jgi:hypothetical protein
VNVFVEVTRLHATKEEYQSSVVWIAV